MPPRPGQRSWPASSKRSRNLRSARSVWHSHPRPAFYSPRGARSTRSTRCQVRSRNSSPVLKSSLPFRTSRSFGIKALNKNPGEEAYPCESPDLPSLPVTPENNLLFACVTDHRSGSATSRQARCPSNLLEPSPSCTRTHSRSTEKLLFHVTFINKYFQ